MSGFMKQQEGEATRKKKGSTTNQMALPRRKGQRGKGEREAREEKRVKEAQETKERSKRKE